MKCSIMQVLAAFLLVLALQSCASYHKSMGSYYKYLHEENYEEAQRSITNNNLINKNRNSLLYNLEMGKLYRLQNDFANSNKYLNVADAIAESNFKTVGDVVVSNIANPMLEHYKGEDYEQFMMHYYKALNYSMLGLTEDAVVEARRITLSNNAQFNKFVQKEKRYSQDAFAMNLQGMIYEMAGDLNNAFIAYRNAVELYKNNNDSYYDVQIPAQLKMDYARCASAIGMQSDICLPDSLFNAKDENGSVIIFIEEGLAPIKKQNEIILTTNDNNIGNFYFVDANGYNTNFDFNYASYGIGQDDILKVRRMRIAMPTYSVQYAQPKNIVVQNGTNNYTPQLAQNINSLAVNILQERFFTEIANALARQITKKVVEKAGGAFAETVAKSTAKENKKDTTEEQKEKRKIKQKENAAVIGLAAGLALNIINNATEKADTRNWQSLPAFVHYVRIPLQAGENRLVVNANGVLKTIVVEGKRGLQMVGVNVN
jgi:uncharacterized protein